MHKWPFTCSTIRRRRAGLASDECEDPLAELGRRRNEHNVAKKWHTQLIQRDSFRPEVRVRRPFVIACRKKKRVMGHLIIDIGIWAYILQTAEAESQEWRFGAEEPSADSGHASILRIRMGNLHPISRAAFAFVILLAGQSVSATQVSAEGFEAPAFHATGHFASYINGADMDGDGDIDIVVGGAADDRVYIHVNDGTGAFPTSVFFGLPDRSAEVQPLDFIGSDLPDLVVAMSALDRLRFYENLGGLQFRLVDDIPTSGLPSEIDVGDLNGDGAPDLAVANVFGGTVHVLLAQQSQFVSQQFVGVGASPIDVRIADVDGDGDQDLVTPNALSDDVAIAFNHDASFEDILSLHIGGSPGGVAVDDFDGDGDMDLIANNAVALIEFRQVAPGPVFTQRIRGFEGFESGSFGGIGFDANLDGVADLVFLNAFTGIQRLDVHMGAPSAMMTGYLDVASPYPPPGGIDGIDITDLLSGWGTDEGAGDFNGDGETNGVDLARLLANFGSGNGALVHHLDAQDEQPGSEFQRFNVADIDGDGDLDVIAVVQTSLASFVAVFRNAHVRPH